MEKKPLTLTSESVDGEHLEVVFVEQQGRFRHGVSWQGGGGRWELLTSREGPGEAMWPSSPPLQQVSPHRLADGRDALLAVGMAGSSHWSLSVAPGTGHRAELVFEAACRPTKRPEQLGSQYDIASAHILAWDERAAKFVAAKRQIQVAVEPSDSVRIAGPEPLIILCDPPVTRLPETFCWTYRITLIGRRARGCTPPRRCPSP